VTAAALATSPSSFRFEPPAGPAALDTYALHGAPAGSYQWWYFDALSDDGRFGFVAIFFVGGVFSALYADRIARGLPASPTDHPMVNVALYDRGRRIAWVLSEYPTEAMELADPNLDYRVGHSRLVKEAGGAYRLEVNDRDLPRGRDVRLQVRFTPEEPGLMPPGARLSRDGRHVWGAPAPRCRVELRGESPGLSFDGWGYHDMNRGVEPLHHGFRHWSWARVHLPGETRLVYDAVEADGTRVAHLLQGRDGTLQQLALEHPPEGRLTPWLLRVPRTLEAGRFDGAPLLGRRESLWESSPFYARWASSFEADGRLLGRGVCEQVDLERFARPGIRWMLRHRIYRMRWPSRRPYRAQVSSREVFPHDPR